MIVYYQALPLSFRLMLLAIAVLLAWYLKNEKLDRVVDWLGRMTRRPVACFLLIIGTSLAVNFICTVVSYPRPRIHDEFSYLLAADTYSHGRLTNPTHPHWKHFETFHVISHPSYMSKYPPANGLALAVGQVTTGHPIVGSWLTLSFALAGLYWMLCGWMSRKWALIGTMILSVNLAMITAWGQTYWGGSPQMLGGVLLFGALRRIIDPAKRSKPIWVYSILFALGASILAFSRPFEGLVCCLVTGILLGVWLIRATEISLAQKFLQACVPVGIIGAIAAVLLGVNNFAVTGDATKLPYSVHSQQYESTSLFIWGSLPEFPEYNLNHMKNFYSGWVRQRQLDAQTLKGYSKLIANKAALLYRYFPFIFGICLIPAFAMAKNSRWIKFALLVMGGLLLLEFQLVHSNTYPHYIAPIIGLFYFVMFQGIRSWEISAKRKKKGSIVLPTVVCYTVLLLAFNLVMSGVTTIPSRYSGFGKELASQPGKHLVFVRYSDTHDGHAEMVYNKSDIDNAQVIWANDLSPESNNELIKSLGERTVWIWDLGSRSKPRMLGDSEWFPLPKTLPKINSLQTKLPIGE